MVPCTGGGVELDGVERVEKLDHVTANRVKAPKRRPPSSIFLKDSVRNRRFFYRTNIRLLKFVNGLQVAIFFSKVYLISLCFVNRGFHPKIPQAPRSESAQYSSPLGVPDLDPFCFQYYHGINFILHINNYVGILYILSLISIR